MINIIYEDNHILVVEKPVNIPVQADSSGDMDLQSLLKSYIAAKYSKPGDVYLGIVHRLDRPVGGVMVFARTSKAASRLTDAFRRREVLKMYVAVVHKPIKNVPLTGTLVHWLQKNVKTNMVTAFDTAVTGAKKAILNYTFLSSHPIQNLSLLHIELDTGRSHQIRVQCASTGFPLWGDQRYNVNLSKKGQQIALFAKKLEFIHPVKKQKMTFELPMPDRDPWHLFP
ncbi:MAG: RluA family pseudouridine synthase [Bacteroidetes bacterium]|nr:RluA family pseudouridine synthase [Bacteroidota bacterium]MCH8524691.1 RluA family pseudouridine synthase [Balneolales bacterium]